MSIGASELAFYAGALVVLFFTPGPVWLGLTARALSGGFNAAWPLALGVVVGDALWPLLAVLGVSWIVSVFSGFMTVLRFVAAGMFLVMGALLIRNAGRSIAAESRLTRPGMWAGFAAGVALILGNPKAILFYMGVLPGFFDISAVTARDMAAIVGISIVVPLVGNLMFALFIDRMRRLVTSGRALRRTNQVAGVLMILVGLAIPFV